jgi:hypothetical protein
VAATPKAVRSPVETFKLLLQRFLLVTLLILAAWFCWANRATFAPLFALSPLSLLLILVGYLFLQTLQAGMIGITLRNRGRIVPLWQLLTLNAWLALLGHSTMLKGGINAAMASTLRQRNQVPVNLTVGLLALLNLAVIFTNAAIGTLTGVWGMIREAQVIPPLYWLVLSTSMLLCVSIVMAIYRLGGVSKLSRKLQVWVANLHAVFTGTNSNEVLALIALVTLTVIPRVLVLSLLFTALGAPLPTIYLIFIAVFSNLLVVAITPANLGLRELVIVLLAGHLVPTIPVLVCVLLADRLLHGLVVLLLGLGGRHQLRQDNAAIHAHG